MKPAAEEAYPAGWNTFSAAGLNILVHPRHRFELGLVYADPDGGIIWRYGFPAPGDAPDARPGRCEALERDRNLAWARLRLHGRGGALELTLANRFFDNLALRAEPDPSLQGRFFLVGDTNGDPRVRAFRLEERMVGVEAAGVQCLIRIPDRDLPVGFFADAGALAAFLRGEGSEARTAGPLFACPLPPRTAWISVLSTDRAVRLATNVPKFFGAESQILEANRALFAQYSTTLAVDGRPAEPALLAPVYWNLGFDRIRAAPSLPPAKALVPRLARSLGASEEVAQAAETVAECAVTTALAAAALAPFDAPLAQQLISGLIARARPDGRIPHLAAAGRASPLAASPLLVAAALKVHLFAQNGRTLRDWFGPLAAHYAWLEDHRAGSAPDRMAYGAPASGEPAGMTGAAGAAEEAGFAGGPAWDGVAFDPARGVLALDSAALASFMCLAAAALARMAETLRLPRDRARFALRFIERRRVLLTDHFDPATGLFRDRLPGGGFAPRATPAALLPLLALRLGPHFNAAASAALREPAGTEERARFEPALAQLIHLALRTQHLGADSWRLAADSFARFRADYAAPDSPLPATDLLRGAPLAQELFDIDWDGRLHFGSHRIDRRVEFGNIKVGAAFHSVRCEPSGTWLARNRSPLLSARPAARILEFSADAERIAFRILGDGPTEITLHRPGERFEATVRVDGRPAHYFHLPRPAPLVFTVGARPDRARAVSVAFRR